MSYLSRLSVLVVSLMAPAAAFAAINNASLNYYKDAIVGTINTVLVPVLIAIAFIVFLWGVFKAYILHPDDEGERKNGHQLILWGVIGFVVILSVWGLVNIVQSVLIPSTASNTHPDYPTL